MYTYSAKPSTIEELQTTIENWFDTRYKEAKPRFSLKAHATGLNVFISRSAHHHLKVEIDERCLLFQVKQTRLNLNLEGFLLSSAYEDEKLCLKIQRDPELEHRLLGSILKEFRNTKHPAFCTRILRAVKDLDTDLTSASIDEATAARTDNLVMLEALTAAPWVSEVAAQDPIVAAKLRGFELRQEMLNQAEGVLSSGKVAELLKLSRQAVDKRRAANQLLALTQGKRGYSYPGFQFADGKTLHGLEETLRNLSALDPWMQLRFFISPHERLGNKTPIEGLRSGRVNDVVRTASGYGEQGAMGRTFRATIRRPTRNWPLNIR
jgi:hypothetical protein